MNCDVLGSTSCRYFNPSSCWQHINIWKQRGLAPLTATSSWKRQRLFSRRSQSFLYHLSETSGDSRTLVTIPYVIRCSIFSNYYVSALTSLQRELALLCQPLACCSLRGGRWSSWGLQRWCWAAIRLLCTGSPSSFCLDNRVAKVEEFDLPI